jgi:hypothetical protein
MSCSEDRTAYAHAALVFACVSCICVSPGSTYKHVRDMALKVADT